jgi:hypothetical protein
VRNERDGQTTRLRVLMAQKDVLALGNATQWWIQNQQMQSWRFVCFYWEEQNTDGFQRFTRHRFPGNIESEVENIWKDA